ncbi:MAG: HK97 family phage prohead protease [Rickettsiales bacterium]|nr:HK97 family phage prohead protease [Pseudomonadota bacterium]MDA0966667.1 HK97 family phage prohead protease [Pseudomonadota bacterium]MDG4543695.1 HK97 family phage prohead protease [Rickettsiales bacterium]MDG4545842.1 HK97 family phage prohead protease [Rickettsiales bacterium]MDG4547384.1 HK97 family phage prohead protease [Rickettsiales bacterium]
MTKKQTKHINCKLDIKAVEEDGAFSGYASVFNVVDSQNDIIANGAFKRCLEQKKDSIKLLWQHKLDEPIGVFENLYEDSHGLFVKGRLLLDIKRAKEAYSLLKSGAINGMSIGYSVVSASYYEDNGVRIIEDVDLFEISLVTFPANENATITSVKSATASTLREYEKFLRQSGYSRSEAKELALYGFRAEEIKSLEASIDRAIEALF